MCRKGKPFPSVSQNCIHNAIIFRGRFHHKGSSTFTENRACGAVGIIYHGRHLIGTHNNHFLIPSRTDKIGSSFHRIQEATTCSLQIKCKSILQMQLVTQNRSSRREVVIRSESWQQSPNQCHLGLEPVRCIKLLGSFTRHVGATQSFFVQYSPFLYPNTGHNPFIVGIHHLGNFIVRQDIVRYIPTDACNYCIIFFPSKFL